ncbi:DNA polymerase iota isoform X2 [Gouania willdenowi]|uniref:DNA polymerase iota isoform X2 n=1 Tax=Gouania willdenowi TaxID=441366 RepID=UPI0010550AEC|nr:DNA polymerase iota isoform X2 [Gouania willdenowi]
MDNIGEDSEDDDSVNKITTPSSRVILHFDLDCFYAQVEMIKNPALRELPLGIQQKYILVTCNYVARERGVTKLMSVTDAKEKCPELVLVKGEDLTHYREMSYKVTELLMSFCPLVERLGFDENFMDVTEMVERKLADTPKSDSVSFKGHVYNNITPDTKTPDNLRLAVGSHIAAELREEMYTRLGLTGCAGIATNKLLAKLVSGTFKPNQQTVLLPESVSDIMGCLGGLRRVPGVGHQTAKRLQALGLVGVLDLQMCPISDLVTEFGLPTAQRLKNLSLGLDNSPVTSSGAPQSLSDEDSFRKMSLTQEVLDKIRELLSSLVKRMQKDGRQPHTFRLTIRRHSATNKWFSRESRQCPIPNHIGKKITSGFSDEAVSQLVSLAMKLFDKMVDSSAAFHITLINVCFCNLQSRSTGMGGKGSISSFFARSTSSPRKTPKISTQNQYYSSQPGCGHSCTDPHILTDTPITQDKQRLVTNTTSSPEAPSSSHGFTWNKRFVVGGEEVGNFPSNVAECKPQETKSSVIHQLRPNVDPEVFKLLPEDIQKELLSPAYVESVSDGLSKSPRPPPFPQSSDCEIPGNVDPTVFSELPLDVQRELMSEWKQHKPVLKSPSFRKSGRTTTDKDRKPAAKNSQTNLLKFFKPN